MKVSILILLDSLLLLPDEKGVLHCYSTGFNPYSTGFSSFIIFRILDTTVYLGGSNPYSTGFSSFIFDNIEPNDIIRGVSILILLDSLLLSSRSDVYAPATALFQSLFYWILFFYNHIFWIIT